MIARSPKATWKYVLKSERDLPKEQRTTWLLGHLSLAQESALLDNVVRDPITGVGYRQALGSEHLNTLRQALKGWDNFPRDDGSQVVYEPGVLGGAKDEHLFMIRLSDREELATAIENEIAFDPDEQKKS
jgi:hypothetical protein